MKVMRPVVAKFWMQAGMDPAPGGGGGGGG